MTKRLAFIHTVTSLPPTFKSLCSELIPDADQFHAVDESLLQNTIRDGKITKTTARRLLGHILSAQEAGAELVMVTCSSMGAAVGWSSLFVDIPVYRVDEAMAELAVKSGSRIGVAATLITTMAPTADLIKTKAAESGKDIQLTLKLCEGAFDAGISGDTARHDSLVAKGLRELIHQSDVIVLAQASMARVVENLSQEEKCIPILSSPRLAVEALAKEYREFR
jgi:aspartate/glutamate racemase